MEDRIRQNKIKYARGKVYKIVNKLTNDIYIGSTVEALSTRLAKHRSACKNHKYSSKLFDMIIDNDWTGFYIILIEPYPCNNVDELRMREQHFKDLLHPAYNTYNCYGLDVERAKETKKEYNVNHKEDIAENHKEYKANHKEDIAEYNKEYRANHKEDIAEYDKDYYKNLPHKFVCNCCNYKTKYKGHLKAHFKTRKHMLNLPN